MKNKAVVVLVILGSLIISIFAGCRQSPLKYIPPTIDSVNNDKSRMGLNGKVKTLDIYYYRPENTSSFFSTKFKKGEKWVLFGPNGIGKSTLVQMMSTRGFPS